MHDIQNISTLPLSGDRRIAYVLTEGRGPTVLFCGGFKSDMTGSKATALEAHCKKHGRCFIRFDYTGHGQSSGEFLDGTIGAWLSDALGVINALAGEKLLLVGSSMGAWIALLAAQQLKERVAGLVGVASAPDFTERLIWEMLSPENKAKMESEGVVHLPSCYGQEPYPISKALVEEGRKHLLLDTPIAINAPVRLLHGTNDEDVPWQTSTAILERVTSADARLELIKGGDHRLSEPHYLARICHTVEELLSV
jgi:pimeloyl-ACP methyl ester carboxylesterase